MDSANVTLVAALVALVGSILSLFISTRLALQRERRQLLWSKELDRFFSLEELAGELVEEIGRYRPVQNEDATPSFRTKFNALEGAAGRFGRYQEVRRAILDLHNTIGRMYVSKRDCDGDERAIRDELGPAFLALLSECDQVLGRTRTT